MVGWRPQARCLASDCERSACASSPVLDKGYIELEEWMGGDDVVPAARICYQSTARTPGADERLIRKRCAASQSTIRL